MEIPWKLRRWYQVVPQLVLALLKTFERNLTLFLKSSDDTKSVQFFGSLKYASDLKYSMVQQKPNKPIKLYTVRTRAIIIRS